MPGLVLKLSEWLTERLILPALESLAASLSADAVSAWAHRKRKRAQPMPTDKPADTD